MGGIIVSEFVAIDGFYADPGGGLDWVTADDEHHDYSISLLERTGLLLFGRRTYEIFEASPHSGTRGNHDEGRRWRNGHGDSGERA